MGIYTLSLTRSLLVSLTHRCCYMQDSNDLVLLYLSVLSHLNLILLALSLLPSFVQHSTRSSNTLFPPSLMALFLPQRKGGSFIRTAEGTSTSEPGPTQLGDSCKHTHIGADAN